MADNAWGAAVSPDGSRIAFLSGIGGEVWVMGTNGEEPRQLAGPEKWILFQRVVWSPDGERLAWMKRDRLTGEVRIESRELDGEQATVILSDRRLRTFCWLPDGHIAFARTEPPPNEASFNIWGIGVDPRTGEPSGEPRRITNWVSFAFLYLTASVDGKRLAFVRGGIQSDVYIGELESAGRRMKTPRRLSPSDRVDWPSGWTPDSRSLLYYSDRNGKFEIFRHGLEDRLATSLAPEAAEQVGPQMSPDGRWVLYLAFPLMESGAAAPPVRLMRIPAAGGTPQMVLQVAGQRDPLQREYQERFKLTSAGYPAFRCASSSSKTCVLAEEGEKQVSFTPFDPLQGRNGKPLTVDVDPANTFWDLSSDGTRIAFAKRDRHKGWIRILPLDGGPPRELLAKSRAHFDWVAWAADGKALFAVSWTSKGGWILHVALDGETRVLHETGDAFSFDRPSPSPDGRYLAYAETRAESNVWMIENFR